MKTKKKRVSGVHAVVAVAIPKKKKKKPILIAPIAS